MNEVQEVFLNYVISNLKDHVQEIVELAHADAPDLERVEFHERHANQCIDMLKNNFKSGVIC